MWEPRRPASPLVACLSVHEPPGGDPAENAAVLERVLAGGSHPSANGFILNAAAALVIADDLAPKVAAARVKEALATGAAKRTLDRWRQVAARTKKNSAAPRSTS